MGFMGFGMHKWIYTMRPRKPFSMQRKGSFTVVPTYSREFKLQPSKNRGGYNFGIILFFFIALAVSLTIPRWMEASRLRHQQELAWSIKKDKYAFDFLLKSGKWRLKKGRISGAYSEFKLAYAIQPENEELNELLLETLEILCYDRGTDCEDFELLEF
ncbi:hypothetical protein [Winogradskyella forsetii]|uniref:hypothetical protein n=1 Tax=Winogradskyella forsetii TaxID=2686077 RepID=UPI0015BE7B77|nr:hypothetical protein [Winogradskyella forsetii]